MGRQEYIIKMHYKIAGESMAFVLAWLRMRPVGELLVDTVTIFWISKKKKIKFFEELINIYGTRKDSNLRM
jgi:hypothetical protein